MPKIFISYSRVDRNFVDDFVPLVREVYGKNDVWVDDELRGGQVWWDEILRQIARCDVFIYLLSNESLESSYCQAEYQEALRLNKLILPVQIRSRTRIPPELSRLQFVDLSSGVVRDGRGMARLIASITQLVDNAPTQPTEPLAPNPIPVPDITLPTKRPPPPNPLSPGLLVGSIVMLVFIVTVALIAASQNPSIPSTTPTTQAALVPTNAQPLTEPPTLDIVFIVATLDAQGTAGIRATNIVSTTQAVIDATATATLWTNTPTPTATFTPNITASINAFQTQRAATSTAQFALDQTATTTALIQLAENGVQRNADWQPYSQTFNGVEMMLVPKGCFNMGSNNGDADEKPIALACFKNPFWIDRTEVTNKQYGSHGRFNGDNRPRESISWTDAKNFCEARGTRLPTEAEWEYTARGPNELPYPWGSGFVPDNVVYRENANNQTAEVGSRPAGASWVGALDMSGNLAEWVSSAYLPYPYTAADGREDLSRTDISRVVRGGAYNNDIMFLRAANRLIFNPTIPNNSVGFRCAKDY